MPNSPYDRFRQDFGGKKILILGLGLLGRGIGDARFFAEVGCPLRITDLKTAEQLQPALEVLQNIKAEYILGEHRREDIDWAEVVVRNAAVPIDHPMLLYAREKAVPVVMDTDLFVRYAGINIIGITGTRGKTTTTEMIYKIFKDYYPYKVLLGGNVSGVASLELLKEIESPEMVAVLELSSWQLQGFAEAGLSPQLAVVTNLYPDHLNAYESMEEYGADKQAIYRNQSPHDRVFFNRHQFDRFEGWANEAKSQVHWFEAGDLPKELVLKVKGTHNRENAAAALAVSMAMGIPKVKALLSLSEFAGVPYRLETVGEINGIKIINDTTATTPTATIKALEAMERPVVLIAGGSDKKLPVGELIQNINNRVKGVVLLTGNGTDRIVDSIKPELIGKMTSNLFEAFEAALSMAAPGETILFSPAFTSFGLFTNEFDRGEQFNRLAKEKIGDDQAKKV